jgi:hypothetical protein
MKYTQRQLRYPTKKTQENPQGTTNPQLPKPTRDPKYKRSPQQTPSNTQNTIEAPLTITQDTIEPP